MDPKQSILNKNDKKYQFKEIKNDPRNFLFEKTISNEVLKTNFYNNRSCIFTYIKDENIYVVYGVISLDLECYDVIKDKKFTLFKKLHTESFDSCRHFFDNINKRNLLFTSSFDKHVKVINFQRENSEIIIDLNFEIYIKPIINTACLINNKIVVPFSNIKNGVIELYNMNKDLIGKMEKCGFILGLSSYYWKKNKKYFILVANLDGITAYNEDNLSIYKEFNPNFEDEIFNGFDEGYVIEKNELPILLSPCFYYEYLFFWDFVNGCLINKITLHTGISDICIWNNDYIFASLNEFCTYHFILINTKYNRIEKKFIEKDKDSRLCGIKLIKNKSKGDFLISFNIDGKLNLYKIKNPKKKLINSIYMSTVYLILLLSIFYIIKNLFKYKILG